MASLSRRKTGFFRVFLLAIAGLAVGAAAISRQSLWMDEGSVAFKSLMPTFKDWLWITFRLGGSDVQMPAFTSALWVWHRIGFTSEYALRCINLPFLVVMVLALRRVRFWPLLCLTSPFVLYYVGELRPYTMQMAGGALAALGLGRVIDGKKQALAGLQTVAGAAFLLTASSLTAAVWAAGLTLGMLVIRPDWLTRKDFWLRALPWIIGGTLILAYYGWSLLQGYRAAASGPGGLLSIGFGMYEMMGLLGIGPSRDELRNSPVVLLHHLPWVLPAAASVVCAWSIGSREWMARTDKRVWLGVGLAIILPLVTLAAVGMMSDFRVLGRHLSPAIAALLLPLAGCLSSGLRKPFPAFLPGALSLMIFVISFLLLRFNTKHFRDDYRTACDIAIDSLSKDKRILWQADMNAARYYAYRKGGMSLVNAFQQMESDPPGLMFADLVVINRPDLRYRGTADYRKELENNNFILHKSFTGFEIWKPRY